jgi:DNA-binding response OmpR family regulator
MGAGGVTLRCFVFVTADFMRLLLVEDDVWLSEGLANSLRKSGYAVDCVADGASAETVLSGREHGYDLVLLDLNLPKASGFDVLRNLRSRKDVLPVLILSAREASEERVRGLDLGADDYLTKPFDMAELEARVRALIRRSHRLADGTIEIGKLSLDCNARRVMRDGTPIELTAREYGLLELLLLRAGHVVSKEQIAEKLCEWGDEMTAGAIEIHIHRVRKKTEGAGIVVRTLRGFGYMLEADTDTEPQHAEK